MSETCWVGDVEYTLVDTETDRSCIGCVGDDDPFLCNNLDDCGGVGVVWIKSEVKPD